MSHALVIIVAFTLCKHEWQFSGTVAHPRLVVREGLTPDFPQGWTKNFPPKIKVKMLKPPNSIKGT